jgi:hypothetical protein
MNTAALTATGLGQYRCSRCHVAFRAEYTTRGAYHSCGKICSGDPIRARYSSTKCADRCMSAISNICECQCEGQNHGGGN